MIIHSDRGSQQTGLLFTYRCAEAAVLQSMGTVGRCFDNAMAESLLATLERELLRCTYFATQEEFTTEMFRFLEGSYNRHRRHSALGYRKPAEFKRITCGMEATSCDLRE